MTSAQFHSVEDIAQVLGVTGKTIRRWIEAGKVRALRCGRLWRISDEEFRRLIGEGGNRMKDFDYKKALRWLNIKEEKIRNAPPKYECKNCGGTWVPEIPSETSGHYDGRVMLSMLCPDQCNQLRGYEITLEIIRAEWEENVKDEREDYVNDELENTFDALDYDATEEEVKRRECEIEKKSMELFDKWCTLNIPERGEFIEDSLAEWMEKQYATRFFKNISI